MKKRLFTELSDETEPVIKRTRLILSSPAHAFDEDELFLSLNSEIKYDDDDIIEITHEHMNSPCQQIDNTIIINSDDDDDDDETTDIPSTMASIVDTFISSPLSDDVQAIEVEEEINIQNDVEIIDLTEDEPTSPCCSFNQLERTSSIDAEECPICLESLSDLQYTGVHLMITQCHHVMCVLCCGQLLANSSRCPLCRENVSLSTLKPYCMLP